MSKRAMIICGLNIVYPFDNKVRRSVKFSLVTAASLETYLISFRPADDARAEVADVAADDEVVVLDCDDWLDVADDGIEDLEDIV